MKILPDSPPPHAFRSSLSHRNCSFETEICAERLRTVNLSRACEAKEDSLDDALPPRRASLRSSSHNDGIGFSGYGDGKGFYAEKLQFSRSHRVKENTDDDDDGMQWANAVGPLRMALQSFGYGDSKGLCAARMASGKENKVRFPCKLASFIARQEHAGPIKPNSGPLRVTAKPNSAVKANMAPSIIPVNLFCKKMPGFDVCEPVSPEVTCLGCVKIKDVHTTTDDKPGALAQKVEKGRCFDAKNQLCGKKAKGRKKKKIGEKLRRRRFASKEEAADWESCSSSVYGETRREKAACLARSLAGLLEDMRRLEKDNAQYVPSVPPPNSLLLMRGAGGRMSSPPPFLRRDVQATACDNRSVCDKKSRATNSTTLWQRRGIAEVTAIDV